MANHPLFHLKNGLITSHLEGSLARIEQREGSGFAKNNATAAWGLLARASERAL
jgi:hypothetical protein